MSQCSRGFACRTKRKRTRKKRIRKRRRQFACLPGSLAQTCNGFGKAKKESSSSDSSSSEEEDKTQSLDRQEWGICKMHLACLAWHAVLPCIACLGCKGRQRRAGSGTGDSGLGAWHHMRRQVELAAAPKALGTFPILQALRAMGHRDTFGAIARRSTWPEGGGGVGHQRHGQPDPEVWLWEIPSRFTWPMCSCTISCDRCVMTIYRVPRSLSFR